jgi:hypothetical protein
LALTRPVIVPSTSWPSTRSQLQIGAGRAWTCSIWMWTRSRRSTTAAVTWRSRAVARLPKDVCRLSDVFVGLGGDGFAVLLGNASADQLAGLMDRIASNLASSVTDVGHPPLTVRSQESPRTGRSLELLLGCGRLGDLRREAAPLTSSCCLPRATPMGYQGLDGRASEPPRLRTAARQPCLNSTVSR